MNLGVSVKQKPMRTDPNCIGEGQGKCSTHLIRDPSKKRPLVTAHFLEF